MEQGEITQLLFQLRSGNREAESRLIQLLYPELHKIAARMMNRERPGHTLQTTGLLHQAYIRLAENDQTDWKNRSHFMAVAAQVMRNILVDHARAKQAQRRGGAQALQVPLDAIPALADKRPDHLLALDEALDALALTDDRAARVLEGHFFGGLTVDELAVSLDVSTRTVKRDLSFAKVWVFARMGGKP